MHGLGDSIYERGITQGISQGMSQGFDLFGRLMNLLLEAGRVDDAKKASTDEAARDRLLREFNLIE